MCKLVSVVLLGCSSSHNPVAGTLAPPLIDSGTNKEK